MRIFLLSITAVALFLLPASLQAEPQKVIHAFVALCDNASQGIVPVPAKIGNGDDLVDNLYWGCDEAIVPCLSKSKAWQKISLGKLAGQDIILARAIFRHRATGGILLADAYRGKEIKTALNDYFAALAGTLAVEIEVEGNKISAGGKAGLVAYVGHDGLMEFRVEPPARDPARPPVVAVSLSCMSQHYFMPHLEKLKVKPYLLTTQLMYPGGFLLQGAAENWLAGQAGEPVRQRAATGYAKNQGISAKSAASVFWVP